MKLVIDLSFVLLVVASVATSATAFQAPTTRVAHVGIRVPAVTNSYFHPGSSVVGCKSTTTTRLQMAAKNDDKKKNRIAFGHQLCSFLFFAVTVGILYNKLNSPGGWGLPVFAASGPYLAAGVSSILSDAASADRLESDTYKRLALFQTEFNLCGISTLILALGGTTLREQLFYGLSLASFLSFSPTLAGYKNGKPKLFSDIGGVIKGFFTCKNLNAFVYLVGTWFVASLKVFKLVDMINLARAGNPAKTLVTRAIRFGRLALLTGVMLVLKDAADRDRLQGTTFIDLNYLAAITFGAMAYYLKTVKGANDPLVWVTAGYSVFTVLNGRIASVEKSKK